MFELWSKELLMQNLNPFEPGMVLFEQGGGKETIVYEGELPAGVYLIELVSSAGTSFEAFAGWWGFASGGSGAVFRGAFKNPKKQKLRVEVNFGAGAKTTLKLDDVEMLTMTGGGSCANANSPGYGGNLIIAAEFEKLLVGEPEIAKNGVRGRTGNTAGLGGSYTISPSTFRPWGDSQNNNWSGDQQNGGFYLRYEGQ